MTEDRISISFEVRHMIITWAHYGKLQSLLQQNNLLLSIFTVHLSLLTKQLLSLRKSLDSQNDGNSVESFHVI